MSSSILTEIISYLTGTITGIGQAIGGALSTLASSIFIDSSGTNPVLSTFGAILFTMAGISLSFGLVRWVLNFITSLGNRNR